jgi:hypothetical protein
MSDHLIFLLYGALAAILTALVGVIATRVRVLPDVIDLSFVPTGSGIASLILVFYGALRRFDPDRIARLTPGERVGGTAGHVTRALEPTGNGHDAGAVGPARWAALRAPARGCRASGRPGR